MRGAILQLACSLFLFLCQSWGRPAVAWACGSVQRLLLYRFRVCLVPDAVPIL